MKQTITALFHGTIVFLLIAALLMPVSAAAADNQELQPLASNYLSSYYCSPTIKGGGRVDFSFTVSSTSSLDELGVLSIDVYESVNNTDWTWVKSYSNSTYSNLVARNTSYHTSSVSYYGISGRYYKAYVCFWGKDNSLSDSKFYWTSAKKAS